MFSFLQHTHFPALNKNSSGNTKLLGRFDQKPVAMVTHPNLTPNTCSAARVRPQANLNSSAPSMAKMVLNALRFDWSTLRLPPPRSPGPGRIRTQRTDRLQKEATAKATTKVQKITPVATSSIIVRPIPATQSTQTQPVLTFLILIPL